MRTQHYDCSVLGGICSRRFVEVSDLTCMPSGVLTVLSILEAVLCLTEYGQTQPSDSMPLNCQHMLHLP